MQKNLPSTLLIITSLCLLTGCATTYKQLTPASLNYQNQSTSKDKLEISYIYDIQTMSSNKRYAKKERKSGLAGVGIKIKNTTDKPLTLTKENFKIIANGIAKSPVAAENYTHVVKQASGVYLLHALWGPWRYTYIENPPPGTKQSEFKYIPIGAIVGLINMIIAATANANHLKTLQQNQIYGKIIDPGVTLFGIAIIPSSSYEPLTFEFVE